MSTAASMGMPYDVGPFQQKSKWQSGVVGDQRQKQSGRVRVAAAKLELQRQSQSRSGRFRDAGIRTGRRRSEKGSTRGGEAREDFTGKRRGKGRTFETYVDYF
ncbi:hypothetical protein Bca101_067563 [Brassica carinata]